MSNTDNLLLQSHGQKVAYILHLACSISQTEILDILPAYTEHTASKIY